MPIWWTHLGDVVHLGVPRGEDHVPEQGHLLFQGARRGQQMVHEVGRTQVGGGGVLVPRVVPVHGQLVEFGNAVGPRIYQLVDGGLVAPGGPGLQLAVGRPETGRAASDEPSGRYACLPCARPLRAGLPAIRYPAAAATPAPFCYAPTLYHPGFAKSKRCPGIPNTLRMKMTRPANPVNQPHHNALPGRDFGPLAPVD